MAEDRTVQAHRVLVAVEEELARAQRDRSWYAGRRDRMIADATSLEAASGSRVFYDGMIAEQDIVIATCRRVLGDPWSVTSDEYVDLALGDHFARSEDFDEDGPPADINREGLPEFNGAWAR